MTGPGQRFENIGGTASCCAWLVALVARRFESRVHGFGDGWRQESCQKRVRLLRRMESRWLPKEGSSRRPSRRIPSSPPSSRPRSSLFIVPSISRIHMAMRWRCSSRRSVRVVLGAESTCTARRKAKFQTSGMCSREIVGRVRGPCVGAAQRDVAPPHLVARTRIASADLRRARRRQGVGIVPGRQFRCESVQPVKSATAVPNLPATAPGDCFCWGGGV